MCSGGQPKSVDTGASICRLKLAAISGSARREKPVGCICTLDVTLVPSWVDSKRHEPSPGTEPENLKVTIVFGSYATNSLLSSNFLKGTETQAIASASAFVGSAGRARRSTGTGVVKSGGPRLDFSPVDQGVGSRKEPLKLSRLPKSGGQSVSGDGAVIGDPSIRDWR